MTMAAKASFKDVARVFGLSFSRANQLSSYIEKSIKQSYEENEEFKKIVDEDEELKKVHTPGVKRIEEVSEFLGIPPENILKLLIYIVDGEPIAIAIRGDREVEETKLKQVFRGKEVRLATDEEIEKFTGQPKGFLSPIGLRIPVYADYSVIPMVNFVAGAGEEDYHIKNVNWGRDFKVKEFVDIAEVKGGDPCPKCGAPLTEKRGIEVGHIFKLGTKYSEAMNATFVDEDGKEKPMVMGCYGIGVTRVMAAAVEQNYDENGIIWPVEIAPFEVIVIPVNVKKEEIIKTAERIYKELLIAGFDVIIDDRNARPGFKFKDADLIGIPYQIVVGKKAKEGIVEIKVRKSGERFEVPVEKVVNNVKELIEG